LAQKLLDVDWRNDQGKVPFQANKTCLSKQGKILMLRRILFAKVITLLIASATPVQAQSAQVTPTMPGQSVVPQAVPGMPMAPGQGLALHAMPVMPMAPGQGMPSHDMPVMPMAPGQGKPPQAMPSMPMTPGQGMAPQMLR